MLEWLRKLAQHMLGSNDLEIARMRPLVERVNALEPRFEALGAAELRETTSALRARLADGETLDDVLPEAFAAVREAARRTLGQRHYDVQLLGGIALHRGKVAEMRTGEGKTLVASLPLYLNALASRGAHLVTTNDYLAKTGAGWMGPVYAALGMSVAYIADTGSFLYDPTVNDTAAVDERHRHFRAITRAEAYLADITYGQNSEFGFDHLRDNMVSDLGQRVQRALDYAIVDEVDSILIDEARTPLIISAQAEDESALYRDFAAAIAKLDPAKDFTVDEKHRAATLTEAGVEHVEQLLGVGNLYAEGMHLLRYLDAALRARALLLRDRDYVVRDGEIIIVDEFTGRLMPGRRWSDGLHQAVEAKEGVAVARESRTWATITLQNYFRMYRRLAGMTGTAATEAEELYQVYGLDVVVIPTHRPMVRIDEADVVFRTEAGKLAAVVAEVQRLREAGRPVLVGTTSVAKNERLHELFERHGIPHEVLNAKNHEREALVIAQAGQRGAVTLATNMAGRGVDIVLGEGIADLGGLHVIGTERHEARRIDNQLRGRAGRQGDPGSSRFYLSAEDDLVRVFGDGRLGAMMDRLGFSDEHPVESGALSRVIGQAQVKVEGAHFDIRKRLLEYDNVLDRQRRAVYAERRAILEGTDLRARVLEYIRGELDAHVEVTAQDDPEDWDMNELTTGVCRILALGEDGAFDAGIARARDTAALVRSLHELLERRYSERERELGADRMRGLERQMLLTALDETWVEHLSHMETLREGIHLRGYGQRDPLIEYKREAREAFDQMIAQIRAAVGRTALHLSTVPGRDA